MPTSPYIDFKFKNNNVLQTTPLMGVSCVLARTTKGPKNDPSVIISSYSQFQRIYGREIVPDGSISNIEKALMGGSKLRIIRVLGGNATLGSVVVTGKDTETPLDITFTSGTISKSFRLSTKGYGDPVGSGNTFQVGFYKQANTIYYRIYSANGQILENGVLVTYKTADTVNDTSVDYLALSAFEKNSQFIKPQLTAGTSFKNIVQWLSEEIDGTKNPIEVTINKLAVTTEVKYTGKIGSAGSEPTFTEWIAALEYVRDYTDFYQFGISHISQHLNSDSDVLKVLKAAADMTNELKEWSLYVEIPKHTTHYSQGTLPRDKTSEITWLKACLGSLGNSKYVSYFGGGLQYYNENGNIQDSDVLGTILGLGDASATNHGPWRSFAGVNRGVIPDAVGPVSPNYGSPSRYADLNELAMNYVNQVVIRDTPDSGRQTMLWHCFTSQVKQDSERFLSIVRLNLYLKKFLRPILNKYLEEPNIWGTWKKIWLEVKPTLDSLVDQDAMSEYTWMGDQNASSYAELAVNNEADVRQGKYRAILKYKDIVPMQEITMEIVIDAASNSVSIIETSNNA